MLIHCLINYNKNNKYFNTTITLQGGGREVSGNFAGCDGEKRGRVQCVLNLLFFSEFFL